MYELFVCDQAAKLKKQQGNSLADNKKVTI